MFRTRNYKVLSFIALVVVVVAPFIAYMKVGQVFVLHQIVSDKTFFQIMVWLIIIFGFMLFYLVWRLVLHIDGLNARATDISEKDFIEVEQTLKSSETSLDIEEITTKILKTTDFKTSTEEAYHSFLKSISLNFELGVALAFARNGDLYQPISKWAYFEENEPASFELGYGLSGKVAESKQPVFLTDLKENYLKIISGSGFSSPRCLFIFPVVQNSECVGVIELAFLKNLPEGTMDVFKNLISKFESNLNLQND